MAISAIVSGSPGAFAVPGDGGSAFVQTTPAAMPAAAGTGNSPNPSPEHVTRAVKQMNDAFTENGQNLSASIEKDQASGISVVKIMDNTTKEVISQYPSKAIVAMAEALGQSQSTKGRLLNVNA